MRIEVYNLTQKEFNDRVLMNKEYVSFYQFLDAIGRLSDKNDISIEERQQNLSDIIENKDTLVISTSDMSSLFSHVFENLTDLLKYLEETQWFGLIVVNSPSKPLLKLLSRHENVKYNDEVSYEKPSEEVIVRLKNNFDDHIIGQDNAKRIILRQLIGYLIRPIDKPLVLMFYGNPGIGKTETAKYLSKELYNSDNIVIEQMSMSYGDNSVKYFKSPKYSEDSFSKTLINRTGNIILLDEFSLSPYYIIDAFYQLFDEGTYQDQYFEVDMRNSIIILTSNELDKKNYKKHFPRLYIPELMVL